MKYCVRRKLSYWKLFGYCAIIELVLHHPTGYVYTRSIHTLHIIDLPLFIHIRIDSNLLKLPELKGRSRLPGFTITICNFTPQNVANSTSACWVPTPLLPVTRWLLAHRQGATSVVCYRSSSRVHWILFFWENNLQNPWRRRVKMNFTVIALPHRLSMSSREKGQQNLIKFRIKYVPFLMWIAFETLVSRF